MAADLFQKLEVLTIAVWSLYPIVVGVGRANMGLVTKPVEDIALCFLDVVAKIGREGLVGASCMSGCPLRTPRVALGGIEMEWIFVVLFAALRNARYLVNGAPV